MGLDAVCSFSSCLVDLWTRNHHGSRRVSSIAPVCLPRCNKLILVVSYLLSYNGHLTWAMVICIISNPFFLFAGRALKMVCLMTIAAANEPNCYGIPIWSSREPGYFQLILHTWRGCQLLGLYSWGSFSNASRKIVNSKEKVFFHLQFDLEIPMTQIYDVFGAWKSCQAWHTQLALWSRGSPFEAS